MTERKPTAGRARSKRPGGSSKERLEFLTLLLDAVEQAVIATDAGGQILYWNRFAEELYGWRAKEVIGKAIIDVLLPAPSAERERGQAAMADPPGMKANDWLLPHRDGRSILVHAVPTSIVDADGRTIGIVGVSWDVAENRRFEQELAEKREQLQALTRRLLEGQEAERRALARELHDDFGQSLTAIRLNLEAARRGVPAEHAQRLSESIALVDQAIDQVRRIAVDLRPAILDDLGLVAALRSLVKRQSARAGFEGRLTVGPIDARLPASVETCSFRLVQEAVTNVARHAGAKHVDVDLRLAGAELCIVVRDDGKGFDAPAALREAARGVSLGLLSMQERVTLARGRFEIRSAADQGTTVTANIPVAGASPS